MSTPPLNLTLSIWQNQTFNDVLTWQDTTGAPINLTGYTAQMMTRANLTDAAPQTTWGTTTGEIVLGGAAGTITFNVSAAATLALPTAGQITTWFYDLVLTAPGGVADRVIQGVVVIYPGVTHP